jgi:uncharacterized phiE125 gp8 family phage protein
MITAVVPDWATLPAAMLPNAKMHCRVDTTFDDGFITDAIGRAIGGLEQRNDVLINPTSYTWKPDQAEFCNGRARIPWSPVKTITADAGGDVSANYAIETSGIHGAMPQYLIGSYVAGLVVTCVAGYAAAADVPPRMIDRIMRLTAHLYEHREILAPGQAFMMPDLELDATDWMPRV